jgi:hypothetical protein
MLSGPENNDNNTTEAIIVLLRCISLHAHSAESRMGCYGRY